MTRGRAQLALGKEDLAATHFREAIRFATEQAAKSWELRATAHLMNLHRRLGQPGNAPGTQGFEIAIGRAPAFIQSAKRRGRPIDQSVDLGGNRVNSAGIEPGEDGSGRRVIGPAASAASVSARYGDRPSNSTTMAACSASASVTVSLRLRPPLAPVGDRCRSSWLGWLGG